MIGIMRAPLLGTKLYVPHRRHQIVARKRLLEQLDRGLERALTLVSAPAGFGKTTLVAEWVATLERPVAWVSLDEADSEPGRFMAYLVAALQTVDPALGANVTAARQGPPPVPEPGTLTPLLNDIDRMARPITVVLDDYHSLNAPAVDEALTFVLEHHPPTLHLVIATRQDPRLPLARLRARRQLSEVRAADLRFDAAEAAEFLTHVMGLRLSEAEVDALESRTEGWIAGLQMAALSMRGRQDTSAFVAAFTGSHRFVFDYLVDEVLRRQPDDQRIFLLQTSILDRLGSDVCDAVTDREGSGALLKTLERDNLFVVHLDDHRLWYRYHHLFRDVLRAHLAQEMGEAVPTLHERASRWFEQCGMAAEAIEHALAAGAHGRAAALLETVWRDMDRSYRSRAWLQWVRELPESTVQARPVLCAAHAWALLNEGDLEPALDWVYEAERWLGIEGQEREVQGMVVTNEPEYELLTATLANARAYGLQGLGRYGPKALAEAERAYELSRERDDFERALAALMLAFARWAEGELEPAREAAVEAVAGMWRSGNLRFVISFTTYLVDILVAQGRLTEGIRTYREALDRVKQAGGPELRERAVLHLGLSELLVERGVQDEAQRHLARAEALGELPAFPPWLRRWASARARFRQSNGDLAGAIAVLDDAEKRQTRHPIPDVRPFAAWRARLRLAEGNLRSAAAWAEARGLSDEDEPSYLTDYEHLTLARLRIAEARAAADPDLLTGTDVLLDRLLRAAEDGARTASAIDVRIVQALAREARGDLTGALDALGQALRAAAPDGWLQRFPDEGTPMRRLVQLLGEDAGQGAHVRAAFDAVRATGREPSPVRPGTSAATSAPRAPLAEPAEPLSRREVEVLHLLADGLSNREIGMRLYRSVDTVKGHNRRIFAKLGARNRTEAVALARELGLLS